MKATGIVRRIDDLGRIVIPKEIRRTLRIREGDGLEIFTDSDGMVIFKKYSPIGDLSPFSTHYAEILTKSTGLPCLISDKDYIISCAGVAKKEYIERRVSPEIDSILKSRKTYICKDELEKPIAPIEGLERTAVAITPIISSSEVVGSIIFLKGDSSYTIDESDIKLLNTASAFLGRALEE